MHRQTVSMVDLAHQHAEMRPQIDAAIARVVDSNQFILGPEVESFEAELAGACHSHHAIAVSSGTDALLVSLMALGVGLGDEVITTAFSFFATAGVIARLGATPVFVDIEEDSFNLDPAATQTRISSKTAALLPVNLYGRPADLPETQVPIVEDAAQSIGSGPLRGTAACYSFFPTKNIGACGDAGAVVSDDPNFADKVRLLRTHGAQPKYMHNLIGGNFRIDALQAAILRIKMAYLESWTQQRRKNAAQYRQLLSIPPLGSIIDLPSPHPAHVYHQFTIRVPKRHQLQAWLADRGVATHVYYPQPLHLQRCFADLGYRAGDLPNTERAANEVLSLPVHAQLQPSDIDYVATQIEAFYQHAHL